ncbi:MAG: DUF6498-containing protein [Gammaproteobacteria bacterium]|nr:DUF6498-containing protein [Gammaproteobacteria bacterium]
MINLVKLSPSSLTLILGNLVPIVGVLFFDWQLFPLILLYWLENIVIGVFNAFKMLTCSGPENFLNRIFMTLFFSFHYGMFCFGHGTFIVDLFGGSSESIPDALQMIFHNGLQWALIALVASHAFSFLNNYLIKGELKQLSVSEVMFLPYKRIIVLHVFIVIGGVVLQTFGVTQAGLVILALVKIVADFMAHRIEHE